ncbi:MAG TPA: tetratricopeptide repeat protein [Polyangiaceae bacterium]|jgi:TPR repeat protein|nr:tetratricopeptide repeat protein [Polyangiaceae bacterium]
MPVDPWTTEWVVRRALRAVALVVFGIGACQNHDASPDANSAATPINVASVVSGCKDLDDCNRKCTEQNPNACVSAGHSYEFGHGVAVDTPRAFQLYEQACAWKYPTGCYNAAVLLEAGKGVVKDPARARQLYAQVCASGSKTACDHAGKLNEGNTSSL